MLKRFLIGADSLADSHLVGLWTPDANPPFRGVRVGGGGVSALR